MRLDDDDHAVEEADDVRVDLISPLLPPQILIEDVPSTPDATNTVNKTRKEVYNILDGKDDRLIVVVGPCSIHDPKAAIEYGKKLVQEKNRLAEDLLVIMRVYFEKPRSVVGWKGLINDPFLDGTFAINKGLRIARQLLVDVNAMGLPAGCEFLDTITPQSIGDLVSWGAIGARTTESQVHRELASGISCAVGFKNGTSGNVQIACDAVRAARHPHHFLGVTKQGLSAIVKTKGNTHCHIILRGGSDGPNFERTHVEKAQGMLKKVGIAESVMIDCSHANSGKIHSNQPKVARDISAQVSSGNHGIQGVMIESFLEEGRQDLGPVEGRNLVYGKSITDACIGWQDTVAVLDVLAEAVRARRQAKKAV